MPTFQALEKYLLACQNVWTVIDDGQLKPHKASCISRGL